MTKLVRKLKQMAKKRAHRRTVQKRKVERAQRELERGNEQQSERLEDEVDREMARLNGELEGEATRPSKGDIEEATNAAVKRAVRIVGDLVLDAPVKKRKRQLTRKQAKRKEAMISRGEAVNDSLAKKWDHKKRRVKVRAQIRNEDLHT
ncbi:hypothetical protein ABB37_00511 [Leptomonas pyrrhocoris]|uniref:Uncharacterized protein n=1 Tax=Leptomonas pyrrhocoris TaxID=157538 RepID=A0A0N0E0C5_LEPPY|nr:hypothetical protein ABB37_00511 [Leptomonas pyrrhocoris]XP_015664724.1 hypothetical protein ABB37_00511 [Leptomonas pyrrhocoris]KPA86284.1 hypothetical protein ABB37_00511 [Leptomonas pyrrhocoris]KPA86285.1 hypothetical protein ABB37_00511 [Leptomonas pyrrhocoris]|eukprot:XP_015664723.1 hypothetical protein ABB37_00511 [Leptomonas pyrrhocoris]